MATSKYSSTEETTNASRVSRVLMDPCTDQLRDVLRHYVPPHTFPQVIQRHCLKLTKPQIDLILPRYGHYSGNYNDFDISLLYLLLRNICNIPPHTKGWGKDPCPNDMSLAANIERIRISWRKVYGHAPSSSLSNSYFNDIWSTVRSSVVEIDTFLNNNKTYEKEVDFLRNEIMDPQMAKQYEEKLRDQVKEDTETRKMITETIQMVQDLHKEHEYTIKQLQADGKRHREEDEEKKANLYTKVQEYGTQIQNIHGRLKESLPGHIMVTEITDSSILLKWEPMNTAEQYTIEYRIPSTEEIQTTVARSCEYRLTNLKHSTEYQVQIKVGTALVTEKIAFITKGLTTEEIDKVYRDINKSKVRLKNVRLMAIGHQGVGKTTLFHRLQNPHYIPSEDELKNIIPTSGIETELNYAVCTESGEMSLLGEEEICRRKLGLNAQEIGQSPVTKVEATKEPDETNIETLQATDDIQKTLPVSSHQIPSDNLESKMDFRHEGWHQEYEDKMQHLKTNVKRHREDAKEKTAKRARIKSEVQEEILYTRQRSNENQSETEVWQLTKDLRMVLGHAQVGTEEEFYISFWDFAGEDAYHDTHVAFMSPDAVYLLLFHAAELKKDIDGKVGGRQTDHLEFWLQNIASLHSEKRGCPKVIVIGTHKDHLKTDQTDHKELFRKEIQRIAKMQSSLKNIRWPIILTNLKTDSIKDIWEAIMESREWQEHWNVEVPTKLPILEYLLTLEKMKGNNESSISSIKSKWDELGQASSSIEDLTVYLKMLSNSGSIVFFENKHSIVTNPSWIIQCFAGLFSPSCLKHGDVQWCLETEGRIKKDLFDEHVMPKGEKERDIAFDALKYLGLLVESDGSIAIPTYLEIDQKSPNKKECLQNRVKDVEKNFTVSKSLAITFKRSNEVPLDTVFFNKILAVLLNFTKDKDSYASRRTCLTFVGKTSGIIDNGCNYGFLYEIGHSSVNLELFFKNDSLIPPQNFLPNIISKVFELNNVHHKKPLDVKLEIVHDGTARPFCRTKSKDWMEHWTNKCDVCKEFMDIALRKGTDLKFIDDEGWLRNNEDFTEVTFECSNEHNGSSEHDGERFRKAFDNSTEYATLQCLFETVHEGVGMVCRNGTGVGTAFRVGSKYIMTAYHIFEHDIDDLWTFVFQKLQDDHSSELSSKWDELAEALSVEKNNVVANTAASIKKTLFEGGLWYDGFRNVSKLTEALAAIIGSTETERLTEEIQEFFNDGLNLKFNYTKEGKVRYLGDLDCNISFGSKRDDVLILELAEDRRNQRFPRSFKLQTYKLKSTDHIHIIGYPGGKVLQADLHCPLLMRTDLETIHKEKRKYWTETHKPKRYRLGADDIEAGYNQVKERNDRDFFHASKSTTHGASGAPGFIVHKNVPVVLVMFVEGYPKFFHNLEEDHQKLTDPKFLVEAGIPMSKISQLLSQKKLIDLKEDIFKSIDKSTIGFIDT